MENISEHTDPLLSLPKVLHVDQICDRFDHAIHDAIQNRRPWPSIEDYLGDATEPVRSELRKELLAIEASYRQRHAGGGDLGPPSESSSKTRLWQPSEPESQQAGGDATAEQPEPAPEASVRHPDHIGRYRIERALGKGAFGTVYLGYDDTLKRPVAIKVPHRHLVDKPDDMKLYLKEAQVVASLDKHPNVVRVHDVGRTEDGLCYVVSEFIEGSDLARNIREKPLSHRESAELVAAIAEALQHAHQHMVVHRDVKPANILIDTAGKPYLADFGLAFREEDFGEGSVLAGTFAYMSPEQARCESHLVDGRADIFSLGVVFYELLTASRPFWDTDREKVLERIKTLEPCPPRQLDNSIPKELERICLKALSKPANDRYTTALDMAEDLRHFLAQTSTPPDVSDNLLHQLWRNLEPDLQDALALAYNQAKREGKQRISTRTFFAAVARLRPEGISPLLDLLPKGSLPEPIEEAVSASRLFRQVKPRLEFGIEATNPENRSPAVSFDPHNPVSDMHAQILVEKPLLSNCIENAFNHLGQHAVQGRKLATEDVFVDVAKFGTGPSVARLRDYGVTPQIMDRLVAQLGWKVIQR
ncbi:MAG: serine/threonine-protein kinase [Thermoguttaceae bacterium]